MEKLYKKVQVSKSDSIMVDCHAGGRAANTTFMLTELLGYENIKNQDGFWTEWSRFEALPFEKDSITILN